MLLEIKDLRWSAPDGKQVLRGVDLRLEAGQAIWLAGPSGGGKSSLLRMINRLNEPGGGEIRFAEKPLAEHPVTGLRRKAAMLTQTPVMFDGTVKDNLLMGFTLKAAQNDAVPEDARMDELIAAVGLNGVSLNSDAKTLSVGQQHRISLIRSLLAGPDLLLLDEPFAPLDEEAIGLVSELLKEYVSEGGACLVVSHVDPGFTTAKLTLKAGKIEEPS